MTNKTPLSLLFAGVLALAAGCATTRPESPVLRDARLALQDARDAGAAELAPDKLALANADFSSAQREWNSGHEDMAMHYAQLADSEARDAEFRARDIRARQALDNQRRRRVELDAALHDAEQRAIAARARSEAERLRLEAELRVREEQARLQAELQARQAEKRAAEERERALQAQLEAEQRQAEISGLKSQLEEQQKSAEAARRAAAEENARLEAARRAEEERRRAAEDAARKQGEEENALVARLQQLEKSTRVEPRGIVITLPGNIYFATNRSDLQPSIQAHLAEIGKALASAPIRHVLIEGHTDSTGQAAYNLKLSQLRADSVRAVLVANGVALDRLHTQGYGATRPVASNATAAERSKNRRVEIVVQSTVSGAPDEPR